MRPFPRFLLFFSTTIVPSTLVGAVGCNDEASNTAADGNGVGGNSGEKGDDGKDPGAEPNAGGSFSEDSDSEEPKLVELTIRENPNNVLSCIVTFSTDQPVSAIVQFGVDEFEWEIESPKKATEHRVVVIGMHANERYDIRALSSDGTVLGKGKFKTGRLPKNIPTGSVEIFDEERAQPGWTLMNVQKGDGTLLGNSDDPPMVVIYDESGQPVWYYITSDEPDIGGALSTELSDEGVVIGPTWDATMVGTAVAPQEVDMEGEVLWSCDESVCDDSRFITHHTHKMENGHYMLLESVSEDGLQSPRALEVTAEGEIVWQFDWADEMEAPEDVPSDWCHGNSITTDLKNDAVYINCRWIGLMKISYKKKKMEWLLANSYQQEGLGDIRYEPESAQPSDTHDPEIHGKDGTVLVFDNGGFGFAGFGNFRSRVMEFELDEKKKLATLVWEFPGDFELPDEWYESWFSPFWGDADRLDNGNVLITGGIRSANLESRVFEVDKQSGEVVWEFRLPPDYGVYRSDRIQLPSVMPAQAR